MERLYGNQDRSTPSAIRLSRTAKPKQHRTIAVSFKRHLCSFRQLGLNFCHRSVSAAARLNCVDCASTTVLPTQDGSGFFSGAVQSIGGRKHRLVLVLVLICLMSMKSHS